MTGPRTYAAAGVNLKVADQAVTAILPHVARTKRPEVMGGIGGFGGLFALDSTRWRQPIMVTATDGVGTKLELARQLGRHETIGRDLVAMVVDDLVVSGAEPLVFLDYIAIGKLDTAIVEQIVAGIADGCIDAGCALVGGEMAEHPGVMSTDGYDLAGFGVGMVERDDILGADRVRRGDALVAMASSGLHSNGYSLVRSILETSGAVLSEPITTYVDQGQDTSTLGEAVLRPTRIYAKDCLHLIANTEVHALCHITGGGIGGNLPRVLPDHLGADVSTGSFPVPDVIRAICKLGLIPGEEQWNVFNMGAGMIAVVPDGLQAVAQLQARGVPAWIAGTITEQPGVRLLDVGGPGGPGGPGGLGGPS